MTIKTILPDDAELQRGGAFSDSPQTLSERPGSASCVVSASSSQMPAADDGEPVDRRRSHTDAPHASVDHALVNRAINILGALLLLCLTWPLFVVLALLIKLIDGGPLFYRSRRLGLNRKPFWMYKFRSLRVDADRILGADLHDRRHRLETPIGTFLRDSRLDELPQLLNVLKGEMSLVGPRPERPEVYERLCKAIPGYDLRFRTRPGLIGYAQVFTPHGAPKRLRSLIDTQLMLRGRRTTDDLGLLGYTLMALALNALTRLGLLSRALGKRLRGVRPRQERRRCQRIALTDAFAELSPIPCVSAADGPLRCRLLDLTDEAILVECEHALTTVEVCVRLTHQAANAYNRPRKQRSVRCVGRVLMTRSAPSAQGRTVRQVIQIEPLTPLNAYKLEKYFLSSSIA